MADFTEIANKQDIMNEEDRIINEMANGSSKAYTSFLPTDIEGKKKMYNMMSAEGKPLMDCSDKEIAIMDVAITPVTVVGDDKTESVVPRVCIAAADGNIYTATSWGCYKSIARLNGVFGTLHFDEGLLVQVKVVKTKRGKTINLIAV